MQRRRRRGGFVLKKESRLRKIKLEPNLRDPLAIHVLDDQPSVCEADVIAQFWLSLQPRADEIGKRSFILRFGDGEAAEGRDPAEQYFAGECEPPEHHCATSPLVSGSVWFGSPAAGSPDSLLKSSRTPAMSF